ncbi:MAG: energy transducer TonB [Longimicrobiaceae bacterium]
MRLPSFVLLVLLAAAGPARAAAQRVPEDPSGDSIPASATVVNETDLTQKPELTNRPAIVRLLTRSYPQALRDEGKAGRVTVTMLIDPSGVPHLVTVTGSSGVPEFDQASLRVTRAMRFTPPVLNAQPVWVRVVVPVEFSRTP